MLAPESVREYYPRDHVDGMVDMLYRRRINEEFATVPGDFYRVGLRWAESYFRGLRGSDIGLTESDAVVDIGCSSGIFLIEALKAAGVRAYGIGIDPYRVPYEYFLPSDADQSRFSFMGRFGEDTGLPDNTAKVVIANNLLHRTPNKYEILAEMKRVAEPGGLIEISTVSRLHAPHRHGHERLIARAVSQELGVPIEPPPAPAEGCATEDIPTLIAASGGLALLNTIEQRGFAKITPGERQEHYLYSLKLSANLLAIANAPYSSDTIRRVRRLWRDKVDEIVAPSIEAHLQRFRSETGAAEPYYADPINRTLFIFENQKS